MHFQQALSLEPHHFTLLMQSSTVRQFKSEVGWTDLWGCLLSSIDYRKSFVQHRSSLVHPWHSRWGDESGFWLHCAFADVQAWDLTGQATAKPPAHNCPALQQSRLALKMLMSTVVTHNTPTDSRISSPGEAGAPAHFFWLPLNPWAAGAKACVLHRSRRAIARQQFLSARKRGKQKLIFTACQ